MPWMKNSMITLRIQYRDENKEMSVGGGGSRMGQEGRIEGAEEGSRWEMALSGHSTGKWLAHFGIWSRRIIECTVAFICFTEADK